jgi:hypothetical protein
MKVLVNIYGNAQDTVQRNTSNLVGKCLASFTSKVSTSFSAHDWLLLIRDVPVGEAGTERTPCASPVFVNGLRPLRMVGRRYFTLIDGLVNHLQNL